MHGELTTTSTADACRELAASGATGLLRVTHARGTGEIGFERGRVVSAASPAPGARVGDRLINAGLLDEDDLAEVLRGQAQLDTAVRPRLGRLLVDAGLVTPDAVRLVVQEQVIDAVFELTTWELGTYEFVADSPHDTPEVPLSVAVDQLFVEVARRRDEWEALSRVIPDLDSVPRSREGSSASTASLEPDEFAVLTSVDGRRSVRTLAEDLGYGEFEAARVIYALILLGLVEVDRPIDEIGAALDDALAYRPPPQAPASPSGADVSPDDAAGSDERWAVEHEGRIFPAPSDRPASTSDDGEQTPSGREDEQESDRGLSAFAELRAFTSPDAPQPPDEDRPTAADEGGQGTSAPEPPQEPPPAQRPAATPAASGDVSEFLRELSRLALDEADTEDDPGGDAPGGSPSGGAERSDPPRPRPRPAPGREASKPDASKRKRRLFGRGT